MKLFHETQANEQLASALKAKDEEITRLKLIEAESEAIYRASTLGEVHYWQGDGSDHPESLCCPVLIEADDLRAILANRVATAAEIKEKLENGRCPHNTVEFVRMWECKKCRLAAYEDKV